MKKIMVLLITVSIVVIPVLPQSGDIPEKPVWAAFNLSAETTFNNLLPGSNETGYTDIEPAGLDFSKFNFQKLMVEDYDMTREEFNRRMKKAQTNRVGGWVLTALGTLGTGVSLTLLAFPSITWGKAHTDWLPALLVTGVLALSISIWGILNIIKGSKTIKKLKKKYSGYVGLITDPRRQTYGVSLNIAF